MQTEFSLAQLADPATADANGILRACMHCGFCTATCPTYLLLGDERDSPRGRIYLIKQMLERGGTPAPGTVTHLDRCLSCLSCMTTCPSGVHYMHLIDHARAYIETHRARPWGERLWRKLLARLLASRSLFRAAVSLAPLARPVRALLPPTLRAMIAQAPARLSPPGPAARPGVFPAEGEKRARVVLLSGCVQPVLAPAIDEAIVRLLTRHGIEVVVTRGQGCCGALSHHLGDEPRALALAKANIAAWEKEEADDGLDAIVIPASGCGTVVKDYGFMLRGEPQWAERAARIAGLARDVSEIIAPSDLKRTTLPSGRAVAYHAACSLQHGQKIHDQPRALLAAAGFTVREIPEGHICCGSAGTYSLLQPELSAALRARKLANIHTTGAKILAAGNIGCLQHLSGDGAATVHIAELLDWATGGPEPAAIGAISRAPEMPSPDN